MPLMRVVAANLKRRRLELELTQTQVADKAGCSAAYVSMLEHGKRNPHLDKLHRIEKALKMPIASSLHEPEPPKKKNGRRS